MVGAVILRNEEMALGRYETCFFSFCTAPAKRLLL
jgi:hypothetical protein